MIRIKILIDRELSFNFATLSKRCRIIENFYDSMFPPISLVFEINQTEQVRMDTVEWSTALFPLKDGGQVETATLSNQSVGFNLVPYASGYDVCVAWLHPKNWKSLHSIALSIPERILGTHVIALCVPEDRIEPRWIGRYDGFAWTGVLAHELAHMLDARCHFIPRAQNNLDYYVPGIDNTHYYDYVIKDLTRKRDEIEINNFQGFDITGMTRLFNYGNPPSRKTWPFSGIPDKNKVYRSSDWRMFFRYKGVMKWESITEAEFVSETKKGTKWVEMAVQEANNIQINYLGLELPLYKGTSIVERIVPTGSWMQLWLELMGWREEVPNRHLIT